VNQAEAYVRSWAGIKDGGNLRPYIPLEQLEYRLDANRKLAIPVDKAISGDVFNLSGQVRACTTYYPTLYLPPDPMVGTSEGASWGIC